MPKDGNFHVEYEPRVVGTRGDEWVEVTFGPTSEEHARKYFEARKTDDVTRLLKLRDGDVVLEQHD